MEKSRFRWAAAFALRVRRLLTELAVTENPWRGVIYGSVLYAVAVGSRFVLDIEGFPFLTFFPVVGISALAGGGTVGVAFALLSGLTAWYLFMSPGYAFNIASVGDGLALAGFALIAAVEVLLIDQLSSALREAEATKRRATDALEGQRAMFLEFQHRVANSLQSSASLLSLEGRRLEGASSEGSTAVLAAASQRLQAMARVHRRLYDPDLAGHAFRDLVEELCRELALAFGASGVRFELDIPEAPQIGVGKLLSLALFVTEAVTNALKHAFSDGSPGVLWVRLARIDGQYELIVRDSGPGYPPDIPQSGGDSLGQLVLRSLAKRIGGTLEQHNDRGAVLRLSFAAEPAA